MAKASTCGRIVSDTFGRVATGSQPCQAELSGFRGRVAEQNFAPPTRGPDPQRDHKHTKQTHWSEPFPRIRVLLTTLRNDGIALPGERLHPCRSPSTFPHREWDRDPSPCQRRGSTGACWHHRPCADRVAGFARPRRGRTERTDRSPRPARHHHADRWRRDRDRPPRWRRIMFLPPPWIALEPTS